jgi:hypothetical protein
VINRRTPNFEQALFFNLNILQENVGAIGVFESAATLAEYAATVRVDWELLPAGASIDQIIAHVKQRSAIDAQTEVTMRSRLGVMQRLHPDAYVIGTTGFARYFGGKFGDDTPDVRDNHLEKENLIGCRCNGTPPIMQKKMHTQQCRRYG